MVGGGGVRTSTRALSFQPALPIEHHSSVPRRLTRSITRLRAAPSPAQVFFDMDATGTVNAVSWIG